MTYKRTIVCLANSRKLNGRCVAGLDLQNGKVGEWIRPVGSADKGELYDERLYAGREEPRLLDIIEIEFLRPRSTAGHPEDHLVNARLQWVRQGSFERAQLSQAIEKVSGCLWFDGGSSWNGQNDKIPADVATELPTSLKLVQPDELTMRVQTEGADFGRGKKKVRGQFSIGGFDYVFSVTDSIVEAELLKMPDGTERNIKRPLLCLSVSEVFEKQNACYKLIAGVLE